ncbi:hypothetical protein HHI36_005087 [Cryptolaemus montrouzieri]|uniref:Uncharacterized protein n=1 Tax=Cryptolaemus montrouzieri TaxID=559131 RepID=A0ABD2NTM4_9CUCU
MSNVTSGFRSTGIYRLDRNAIPEHHFSISDAASGQINPKQQVNEDQAAKSNRSNDHRTTSPQPGMSREIKPNPAERSEEVDSKVLQEVQPVPVIPLNIFCSQTIIAKKDNILSESELPNKKQKKISSVTKKGESILLRKR